MHQLGEDDRILAEYLEDNGQPGCKEDVQTTAGIARIFAVVLATPRINPNRRGHQVAHKLSSHRAIVR